MTPPAADAPSEDWRDRGASTVRVWLDRHDPDYAAWLTDVSAGRVVVDDEPFAGATPIGLTGS